MNQRQVKYICLAFLICALAAAGLVYYRYRAPALALADTEPLPGAVPVSEFFADGAEPADAAVTGIEIKAYITGAVASPGMYALPEGSRVDDLLKCAGGPEDDADLNRVNLAAYIKDVIPSSPLALTFAPD